MNFLEKQNIQMLYDCKDIGGFLELTLLLVYTTHQNQSVQSTMAACGQRHRLGKEIKDFLWLHDPVLVLNPFCRV